MYINRKKAKAPAVIYALLYCLFICAAAPVQTQADTGRQTSAIYGKAARIFPLGNNMLCIEYTDKVFPGDAVFIRCTLQESVLEQASAKLRAPSSDKTLLTAALYEVPAKTKDSGTKKQYIALLPLSSWYEPGTFTVALSYRLQGKTEESVLLPLTMQEKQFASETVKLDSRNTAIKTDTSPQRAMQIERLNKIFETVDYTAVYHRGVFALPVTQTRRTAFFADRRKYVYANGKSSTTLHYGIDFGIPTGTPVYACGDGKVVLTENRISTGYSVVIEHLPGLYSIYYHLSSYSVKEGDTVRRGSHIGLSGATGLATGPHLHWEVRLLGTAVNPDLFVQHFPIEE